MSSQPVNPLNQSVPIVNPNGTPTWEFMRKWAQQFQTNDSIPDLTAVTGDITIDAADVATLAATGVTADTYGDTTHYPVITVDAKGRVLKVLLEPASSATGANPTATASDTAVNGTALTFLRSDGAPAVQKADATHFGLAKPDGTSIVSVGGVFSATGGGAPGTPPTIVQKAFIDVASAASTAIVLSTAPVNGNLLIAMGTTNSITAASGWTALATNSGGSQFSGIFYKVAGASESATQTPVTGSGNNTAIIIYELHGQAGTPFVFGSATVTIAAPSATTSPAPGIINVLALATISGDAALSTFAHLYNMTQDVNSAVARGLAAGHSNASAALAQLMVGLSSNVATRSNIVLVSA